MKALIVAAALTLVACTSQLPQASNQYDYFAERMTEFDGWTLASGRKTDWLDVGDNATLAFTAGSEPNTALMVGCVDGRSLTAYLDPGARTNAGYDQGTLLIQADDEPVERFVEFRAREGFQGFVDRTAERSWHTMRQAQAVIRIEQFGRIVEYPPDSDKILAIIEDRCLGGGKRLR